MDELESLYTHFFQAHPKTFQNERKLGFLGFVRSARLQRPDPVVLKWKDFSLTSIAMPTATWPHGSALKVFVKQHIAFPLRKRLVRSSRNRDHSFIPMGKDRVTDAHVQQSKCTYTYTYTYTVAAIAVIILNWSCRCEARPWHKLEQSLPVKHCS